MNLKTPKLTLCAFALLACASTLQAITYVVPQDRDLVRRARAIVVASVVESHCELTADDRVVTVTTIEIEQSLKGDFAAGETIRLTLPGGEVGDRFFAIPGMPHFSDGRRYALFLTRNVYGEWLPWTFDLGMFDFVDDLRGRHLLARGEADAVIGFDEKDFAPHVEQYRDAAGFLAFVRGAVADDGAPLRNDYFVNRDDVLFATFPQFRPAAASLRPGVTAAARTDYLWNYPGYYRWSNGGHATFVYTGSQPSCSTCTASTAVNAAMNNWDGQGTSVAYVNGGTDATATGGLDGLGGGHKDGKNGILFGDPMGYLPAAGAPNTYSIGGFSNESGTYVGPDGLTYHNPTEVDVVVGSGVNTSQVTFNGLITHEVGHTLGFRHSDRDSQNGTPCPSSLPCSSTAVMTSTIPAGTGTLQQWDKDAIAVVYGSGITCTAVGISSATATPSTITQGSSSSLNVVATGNAPLSYQWYVGSPGDTTTPVPSGNTATISVSPSSTTTYWAQVTNSCPSSANSAAVTVTVNPPTCTAVGITSATATPSTISQGSSSSLNVAATGTGPLSYQWYVGSPGTTTSPVPSGNTATISVSPSTTTTYWAQVTNSCPSTMNSAAVTVTVNATGCTNVSISSVSASPSSISSGGSSNVYVSAAGTGPLTYQWYIGPKGDTSTPAANGTTSSISVAPSQTTTYWVLVSNACPSSAQSNAVTVTVNTNTCTAPFVTSQPADQQVTSGGRASLSMSFGGTNGTVTWYQGSFPDRSNAIGTGTNVSTPPLTTATTFWAEVVNSCGTTHTRDVSVTIAISCIAPGISSISASSNSVTPGTTVTLTVVPTGTAPQFQWFIGQQLDTSNPLPNGTTAIVTDTPTATRTYWVRVTNSCGTANSDPITVTVSNACPLITINSVSPDATISSNNPVSLNVAATGGTLHYQWYEGPSGETSKPVGSDSPSFTSETLFAATSYWVKVSNSCGTSLNGHTINVTVVPAKHRASRH